MQERVYIEHATEGYIEIVDVKSGHRVVTTIEVLSPTNKRPGEGQRLYLQKQADMKQAGVNIVEIDLLRRRRASARGRPRADSAVASDRLSNL